MVKRGKLYTVNKWNRPAFMPVNKYSGEEAGSSLMDTGGAETERFNAEKEFGSIIDSVNKKNGVVSYGANNKSNINLSKGYGTYFAPNAFFSGNPSLYGLGLNSINGGQANTSFDKLGGTRSASIGLTNASQPKSVVTDKGITTSTNESDKTTITDNGTTGNTGGSKAEKAASLLTSAIPMYNMGEKIGEGIGDLFGIGSSAATAASTVGNTANTVANTASMLNGMAATGANSAESLLTLGSSAAQSAGALETAAGGIGAAEGASEAAGSAAGGASAASSLAGAGIAIAGNVGKHFISNGLQTNTGDYIGLGANAVGGVVSAFNPLIGGLIAGVGNLIGGAVNAGWGHKVYGVGDAQNYLYSMKDMNFDGNNDYLAQLQSQVGQGNRVTYKDGWFTHKGRDEADAWNQRMDTAYDFAQRGITNSAQNNMLEQQEQYARNFSAFGGPIDTTDPRSFGETFFENYNNDNMGAVEYGLMTDYINSRNRQSKYKEKSTVPSTLAMNNTFADGGIMIKPSHEGLFTEKANNAGMSVQQFAEHVLANKEDYPLSTRKQAVFARNARKFNKHSMGGDLFRENDTLFALGGDLQSNGANWGHVTEINAGGSHEMNPHEGVRMGTDREGTPNLVEENEVIYKDYVFSARLKCPKDVRTELGVKGKKDMSFAEVAKKLEDESKERPNDPISTAGLDAMMKELAQAQEELKKELEAERAKAEFDALSPEEQTAIMEQRNAQQQAMEQQVMQQQMAAQQQPSPEQMAMAQQGINPEQMAMAQQQMAQGNMGAYGGKIDDPSDWQYLEDESVPLANGGKLHSTGGSLEEEETPLALGGNLYGEGGSGLNTYNYIPGYNLGWYGSDGKYTKEYLDRVNALTLAQVQSQFNDQYNFYKDTKNKNTDRWKAIDAFYKQNPTYNNEGYKLTDADLANVKNLAKDGKPGYMHWLALAASEDSSNGNTPGGTVADASTDTIAKADTTGGKTVEDVKKKAGEGLEKYKGPIKMEHSTESLLKYAPAFGGAVGFVQGLFTPSDYRGVDAISRAGSVAPTHIKPAYLGDRLTYTLFDRNYYSNKLAAQAGATRRAIMNSGLGASRGANLLAADFNTQGKLGDLYRQAEEYNLAQRQKVAEFNRATNQFNREQDMIAQRANQAADMQAAQNNYQATLDAYKLRDAIDARRASSMSANLTNLFDSLGQIGEEAYDADRLQWLERTGTLKSNFYDKDKYQGTKEKETTDSRKKKAAYGGMLTIHKKRGGKKA